MKFEKISVQAYEKYLRSHKVIGETENSIKSKIDYFVNTLTIPKRGTADSAGYDFVAPFDIVIGPGEVAVIPTGLKIQMDKDKFLAIYIRSSFGTKRNLELVNKVCVIDADYYNNDGNEGHILEFVRNNNTKDKVIIKQGEAFCQGIIQNFYLVDDDDYGKGDKRVGGIGSTDGKENPVEPKKEEVKPEPEPDKSKLQETEITNEIEVIKKENSSEADISDNEEKNDRSDFDFKRMKRRNK